MESAVALYHQSLFEANTLVEDRRNELSQEERFNLRLFCVRRTLRLPPEETQSVRLNVFFCADFENGKIVSTTYYREGVVERKETSLLPEKARLLSRAEKIRLQKALTTTWLFLF